MFFEERTVLTAEAKPYSDKRACAEAAIDNMIAQKFYSVKCKSPLNAHRQIGKQQAHMPREYKNPLSQLFLDAWRQLL